MLGTLIFGYAVSLTAPLLTRVGGAKAGWILALAPLVFVVYLAGVFPVVANGEVVRVVFPWVPSLGLRLSFCLDGLSLLFAFLISGIGVLIFIYAGRYLAGHRDLGRFYASLSMFAASMLGLVLADNLILLFIFWELTSVSSYLLIGFDHEREAARAAAMQALLVTFAGGLAMLAGLILLGQAGGSWELSVLLQNGGQIQNHRQYETIFLLILIGALTKSAQFPFHFWLPGAMEAPTPVSAYLHSATMVKAGVYLLARFHPILGGTDLWHYTVTVIGAVTMLVGAALALAQTDLKRLLAYSTVSALGTLVLLLGLGTIESTQAAMVFLLVHSLYKGALFLVAGILDHETGTRDVERLSGLRRAMPITTMVSAFAALSMVGLPPLLGFIGKELLYEAQLQAPQAAWLITGAGVIANVLLVAVAVTVGLRPYFGPPGDTPKKPHEAPLSLLFGPSLLAVSGLVIGIFPELLGTRIVGPAVSAVRAEPTLVKLVLWHGWNPILALSVATLVLGLVVYACRAAVREITGRVKWATRLKPSRWYDFAVDGLNLLAREQTRVLQSGYLRIYLVTVLVTTFALAGFALLDRRGMVLAAKAPDGRFYEWVIAGLIVGAAFMAVWSPSRLGAVAALGTVGYGVAMIFIAFGAPDLAMTQFVVESLTVILFVLVFYHLPRFTPLSPRRAVVRDSVIALLGGGVIALLVLQSVSIRFHPKISDYFGEYALTSAHGRNVVNVILVDFRALDTLGEITVLGIAALGVYALLKFPRNKQERISR